jgi:hypothetical protein
VNAGSSGTAGRRQLPLAAARSRLGPAAQRFRKRGGRRKKPAGWCGGRKAGFTQPAARRPKLRFSRAPGRRPRADGGVRGASSALSREESRDLGFPEPSKAVGKKLSPQRGGRRASLKPRARNAEFSAESRYTCYHCPGIARCQDARVQCGSAFRAPSFLGGTGKIDYGAPGAAKNTGGFARLHFSCRPRHRVRAKRGPMTGSGGDPVNASIRD